MQNTFSCIWLYTHRMYRKRASAYSIPNDLMIHQIHFCHTKSPIGFWLHCFILSAARHCSSSLIEYSIWKYTHPNCIVLKLNFHPIQRYQTKWSNFDSGTSAAATTHNSIILQAPVFYQLCYLEQRSYDSKLIETWLTYFVIHSIDVVMKSASLCFLSGAPSQMVRAAFK